MLTKRVKSKDVTIEQINTDIPRTFPTNIFFRGKDPKSLEQPLFNVLLAFANHNPRIGKDFIYICTPYSSNLSYLT